MIAHRIRPADHHDLAEIVRIYNHYVATTHITFDTEPFTTAQRRPWFLGFSESGPHRLLVTEVQSRVVGYASSREFRVKAAYRPSVETSIYLDPNFTGRGLGRRLYGALIEALTAEDTVHRAYGGIALPNPESVALHQRFGFRLVGTFHEVGFKFGRYWDVSWYEKDVAGTPRNARR